MANDNMATVTIRGVALTDGQAWRFADAEKKLASSDLDTRRVGHRMLEALDQEIDARLAAFDVDAALVERQGLEALRGYEIGKSKIEGLSARLVSAGTGSKPFSRRAPSRVPSTQRG